MSFREDKLILLIDTGTSAQVRRTAAKQLSDHVLKIFRLAAGSQRPLEDTTEAKGEEESVKVEQADVKPDIESSRVELAGGGVEDAWTDVLGTVMKILPLLQSKVTDTRHAAAFALGLLASTLPDPPMTTTTNTASPSLTEAVDLASLLRERTPLLASAGREYVVKPSKGDRAKARKAMMDSVGLDGMEVDEDMEKMLGGEDTEETKSDSLQGPSTPPVDVFEGLSARQVTMLKRKKGNIMEEANKYVTVQTISSGSDVQTAETQRSGGRNQWCRRFRLV